ncbi:hypothetical protein [Flaviaesturariibacter terrae]
MKHLYVFLLLALAGSTTASFAQTDVPRPYQSPYAGAPQSRSELLFNNPVSGSLQHQFTFGLVGGNTMRIEVSYVGQLQQLNDLDSLFRAVWTGLQPFYDSLNKPLVSRRIDYRIGGPDDVQVRILETPQQGEVYRIRSNDTSQVKVEQDSLRIILYTTDSSRDSGQPQIVNGRYTANPSRLPYVITLVLNNITDLPRLSAADLHWALTHVKDELGRNLYKDPSKQYLAHFSAAYDVSTRKKVSPDRVAPHAPLSISPYVQVGFQFARGSWLPSAGTGIELTSHSSATTTRHYRIIWEPYFTFGRNADGKVSMDRNDFATFQYSIDHRAPGAKAPMFAQNFSFGYLRHQRGNTFESGTFKFSLPGLQTKNLLIEPEFFFNGFFRNFSPSLKLTLNIE